MKTNWLILLLMTGMAACSSKDEKPAAVTVPAALRLNSGIRQSPGTYTPLPGKTEAGLFITSAGQPVTAVTPEFTNLKCIAGSEGILHPENPVRLTENESYTIYAYAPYRENVSDPGSLLFTHGTDVLGCTTPAGLSQVSAGQYTATLEFTHRTAQIRFIVEITDIATLGELAATSVLNVSGFLPAGRLNLSDGSLTGEGEPSDATSLKAAATRHETTGKYTLESQAVCYFILSGREQTLQIRVTHNGTTYTGSLAGPFHPGESYTYTIQIARKSGLTLKATLSPWTEVREIIEFN